MKDLTLNIKFQIFMFLICQLFLLSVFIIPGDCKKFNECGEFYLVSPRGEIRSPNYPLPYPNNISCTWTILSPPNAILTLLIKDVDIEEDPGCLATSCCKRNGLTISADNKDDNERICGRNPELHFKSRHISRNRTVIKFFSSDGNVSHRGFFLSYFFSDTQKSLYCQVNEFRCGDGKCLPGTMRCDRVAQCIDQTDEVGCQDDCIGVGKVSCGPQAVADCFDNTTQRCNGIRDCMSGRDEIACDNTAHCDKKCRSGGCYSFAQACDNTPHCPDYTDEIGCGLCGRGQALCGLKTSHCFSPLSERCDNISQCPYGEDEVGCVPGCESGISCDSGERCYPIAKRCNSQIDCLDGSDEKNCPKDVCLGDSKMCNNAKCLHHTLWCDGKNDCGDNSDEENCIRNSVISATIMGCLSCGLLLVVAVLCTLRLYTKRTMMTANYGLHLPPHVAARLNMTHSISLPALIDDEYFHREPPPAYSVAVGEPDISVPVVPGHASQSARRHRSRRHHLRPFIKPPTPPPSSETSNQSSPSRDSITSSSYLSNDDNVCLIDA